MKDGGSVGRRTYGDERGKGVVQGWGVGGVGGREPQKHTLQKGYSTISHIICCLKYKNIYTKSVVVIDEETGRALYNPLTEELHGPVREP